MRTTRIAMAGVALILMVGTACSSDPGATKISLTVHEDPPTLAPVDVGTPGNSPGDSYYFFASLRDQPGGAVTGELFGTKTLVKPAPPDQPDAEQRATTLYFTFANRQDQIIVAGVPDYPPNAPEFKANLPVLRAVLGGTGKYKGVAGELRSTRNPDSSYKQVFALTKP
jgi:hypothetical protein